MSAYATARATVQRTQLAPARPSQHTPERVQETRPALYIVPGQAPARSRVPFILLIVGILVAALSGTILLNAQMANTAFQMQKVQVERNIVTDHISSVSTELQAASSSAALTKRATELGMVPASSAGVVDLNARTLTEGKAATAAPAPVTPVPANATTP